MVQGIIAKKRPDLELRGGTISSPGDSKGSLDSPK